MYKTVKFFFDSSVSFLLLLLLSPLFVIVSLIVFLDTGNNPIFTQKRIGQWNKTFRIIKFRTMILNHTTDPHDLTQVTKTGTFLRNSSIDEIPQLLNVLIGDMSFVGPRPLLADYADLFTPIDNKRHNVKPGITGLAQVMGRNALNWNEKFKYDRFYAEHMSFLLDLKILLKTLKVIGSKKSISQSSKTSHPFRGNHE